MRHVGMCGHDEIDLHIDIENVLISIDPVQVV